MGCDQSAVLGVVSTSEFELPSSKVTCLLVCTGLGESTHLLAASPAWPSTGRVCPWGLASRGLLQLLEWPWLLQYLILTTGDCLITPSYHATHERQNGSAALCVPLTWLQWPLPSSEHPWLPLGLPPRTPAVLKVAKVVIGHLCLGMEFHLSRSPSDSDACRPSPWLLWLGRTLPMMEACLQQL